MEGQTDTVIAHRPESMWLQVAEVAFRFFTKSVLQGCAAFLLLTLLLSPGRAYFQEQCTTFFETGEP